MKPTGEIPELSSLTAAPLTFHPQRIIHNILLMICGQKRLAVVERPAT